MERIFLSLLPGILVLALTQAALKIQPENNLNENIDREGIQIILKCISDVDFTELTDIAWYDKNDQPLEMGSPGKNDGKFTVVKRGERELRLYFNSDKVTPDDSGSYRCKANGGSIEASNVVNLYRGIKIISESPQYIELGSTGENARVYCKLAETTVDTTLTWIDPATYLIIKNDDRISQGYDEGEAAHYIQLDNVMMEDAKSYRCEIEGGGESVNKDIEVVVTEKPKFDENGQLTLSQIDLAEGAMVELNCHATGTPAPMYTFKKEDKNSGTWTEMDNQPQADGKFTIAALERKDEGQYQCVATNRGGEAISQTELDVKIAPKITSSANLSAIEDEADKRISCVATGDPAPTLMWKKYGTEVVYTTQDAPDQDNPVYSQDMGTSEENDEFGKVFTVTKDLVFSKVKPSDAGEYECVAAGFSVDAKKAFKVEVKYKPHFQQQKETEFWGWEGSGTSMKCIADGNPVPSIEWQKLDGEVLEGKEGFVVTRNSDLEHPHHIESTLIPTHGGTDVYGEYICKASNAVNSNEIKLQWREATKPDPPSVSFDDAKATRMIMDVTPPANNGGQKVTQYIVKYRVAESGEELMTRTFDRKVDEDTSNVIVDNLKPSNTYEVYVSAINKVGEGEQGKFSHTTSEISNPESPQVMSDKQGTEGKSFLLKWDKPPTGGAPITRYVIEVEEVETMDEGQNEAVKLVRGTETYQVDVASTTHTTSQYRIPDLKKETWYKVQLTAKNQQGASPPTVFYLNSGKGTGISTGGSARVQGGVTGMVLGLSLVTVARLFC